MLRWCNSQVEDVCLVWSITTGSCGAAADSAANATRTERANSFMIYSQAYSRYASAMKELDAPMALFLSENR